MAEPLNIPMDKKILDDSMDDVLNIAYSQFEEKQEQVNVEEIIKELNREEKERDVLNSSTQTLAVLPTQWEMNPNDPRIKQEKDKPQTVTKKSFNIGITFDRNEWDEVRPFLSRIKHLETKKINGVFYFDSKDLINVINLGKPKERKRSKAQQYSLADII